MLKKYYLGFFFFISIIVGTVSHEIGHYFTARALGYDAFITYKNTVTGWEYSNKNLVPYYERLRNGENFPEKGEVLQKIRIYKQHQILISMGGPILTLIMGLVGILILFLYYNNKHTTYWQWLWIFISLFLLRFPFVFTLSLITFLLVPQFFNISDEIAIASMLKINPWIINTTMAFIGAIGAAIVFFKFIPVQERKHFILWALISIPISYAAWFYLLGPLLLPEPTLNFV